MKLYAILSPKQIPIHQTILVEMAPGVSSVIADSLEGSCIRLAFQGWKQMMGQLIQCSQVPSQTTCSMCLYYFRFCCSPWQVDSNFYHAALYWQDWPPKFDTFEKVFYFWLIYVGANIVWVVVPVLILMQTLFEMDVIYNKAAGNKKKMKWLLILGSDTPHVISMQKLWVRLFHAFCPEGELPYK